MLNCKLVEYVPSSESVANFMVNTGELLFGLTCNATPPFGLLDKLEVTNTQNLFGFSFLSTGNFPNRNPNRSIAQACHVTTAALHYMYLKQVNLTIPA